MELIFQVLFVNLNLKLGTGDVQFYLSLCFVREKIIIVDSCNV